MQMAKLPRYQWCNKTLCKTFKPYSSGLKITFSSENVIIRVNEYGWCKKK